METLAIEPRPLPPSMALIHRLLSLQGTMIEHGLETLLVLERLPALLNLPSYRVGPGVVTKADLAARMALLKKYLLARLGVLSRFSELLRVYTRISGYTEPVLRELLQEIRRLKTAYHTTDAELSDSVSVPPETLRRSVVRLVVNYLLHGQTMENALQYVLDLLQWLAGCGENSLLAVQKLGAVPELFDLNNAHVCLDILLLYGRAYPKEGLQLSWLHQSLQKEFLFDPESRLESTTELNVNLILKRINDKELNMSPQSFSDFECKVLDFMEYVTFHIWSIQLVLPLVITSMATMRVNLFYYKCVEKVRETPLRRLLEGWDQAASTLSDDLAAFTKILVEKGTRGLSRPSIAEECIARIKTFVAFLRTFVEHEAVAIMHEYRLVHPFPVVFKEQYHFVSKLQTYISHADELLGTIENDALTALIESFDIHSNNSSYLQTLSQGLPLSLDSLDSQSATNTSMSPTTSSSPRTEDSLSTRRYRFERAHSLVSDTFFEVVLFEQRFNYELKIAESIKSLGLDQKHEKVQK